MRESLSFIKRTKEGVEGKRIHEYEKRSLYTQNPDIHLQKTKAPAHKTLSKAGISVCASQNENTSFGPVMRSLGVSPLKKLVTPSFFIMLPTILNPLSGFSKFLFCIRVLMTSRGAETIKEALAPAMEAMKFWR